MLALIVIASTEKMFSSDLHRYFERQRREENECMDRRGRRQILVMVASIFVDF